MSDTDKTQLPEKDMATEPANISNGQVLETDAAGSHSKLKSRHLYMIAMGGKKDILISRRPRTKNQLTAAIITSRRLHRNRIFGGLW
jgi:hypothetical protein